MRAICLLSFTSLRQHPRPHGDHRCQKRPVSVARATATQTRQAPVGTRALMGTRPWGLPGGHPAAEEVGRSLKCKC